MYNFTYIIKNAEGEHFKKDTGSKIVKVYNKKGSKIDCVKIKSLFMFTRCICS